MQNIRVNIVNSKFIISTSYPKLTDKNERKNRTKCFFSIRGWFKVITNKQNKRRNLFFTYLLQSNINVLSNVFSITFGLVKFKTSKQNKRINFFKYLLQCYINLFSNFLHHFWMDKQKKRKLFFNVFLQCDINLFSDVLISLLDDFRP